MKRILTIFAASMFFVTSCSEVNLENPSENLTPTEIGFKQSIGSTRADLLGVGDALPNIMAAAYYSDFATAGVVPYAAMQELVATNAASTQWQFADLLFWPQNEQTLDFVAYSPVATPENGLEYLPLTEDDIIELGLPPGTAAHQFLIANYTMPESPANHPDLVYASVSNRSQEMGTVNLEFVHALSAVTFMAKGSANQKVKSITITNVYRRASALLLPDSFLSLIPGEGIPPIFHETMTYTQEEHLELDVESDLVFEMKDISLTSIPQVVSSTYVTAPQYMGDYVTGGVAVTSPNYYYPKSIVKIVYTENNIEKNIELRFPGGNKYTPDTNPSWPWTSDGDSHEWFFGQHYRYTISLPQGAGPVDFTVVATPWEEVFENVEIGQGGGIFTPDGDN